MIRRIPASALEIPERLREAECAPEWLWIAGALNPELPAVAVVGSRKPSPYGRRMARSIAAGLARAGIVVVSGLARGIDAAAHEEALEAGGITWAVLGSGLRRIYPVEHTALAQRIFVSGGALISQFEPDRGPRPEQFPMRNAIVSGLSLGVVVVEGAERSGSLITARLAGEQGREVMAVPAAVDRPLGAASYRLLRAGASPVRDADSVMEALGIDRGERPDPPALTYKEEGDTLAERKVLDLLGSDHLSIEELSGETGFELPRLLSLLSYMEGKGLIEPVAGQGYARS